MSLKNHNGDVIKHRDGHEYKIVGVGAASQDPKFFGKRQFVLRRKGTMLLFKTYGRGVVSNSRLLEHKESQ
jgi:hypothetical protein